jgi:hypothetical protein
MCSLRAHESNLIRRVVPGNTNWFVYEPFFSLFYIYNMLHTLSPNNHSRPPPPMGYESHPYPRALVPIPHDPAAVDFRAFYPYTPNEVKHRKRTTSAQLKVLEAVFKKDTKPNANLRTELAHQLDMTPRGVQVRAPLPTVFYFVLLMFAFNASQVWFQNRSVFPPSSLFFHPFILGLQTREGESEGRQAARVKGPRRVRDK